MIKSKKIAPEALAILNIIYMCERFHTLPRAGGLLDQDSLFVELLHNVMVFEEQRAELDRRKPGAV